MSNNETAWPFIANGAVCCPYCLSKVVAWRTMRCEFNLVPVMYGGEPGHYGYGKREFQGSWECGLGDNSDYLQMHCSSAECGAEWWLDEQTPENYEIAYSDPRWPKELA